MKALIVKSPFGGFEPGNIITDPAIIAVIQNSEQVAHVVATDVPVETKMTPEPEAQPE